MRQRLLIALLLAPTFPAAAQAQLTGPREALGFEIGDDYQLATYSQLTRWWQRLDAESDRMTLVSIGKTAEGRDQWMAVITAPENHARLDELRSISARLARAEVSGEEARALAASGKAVVWIDGGLHATEVLGAHQLMEHVWQMVSRNDDETLRILRDVIQLVVHANPDGMDLVSSWYMRHADPLRRSTRNLPRLYQKYVGHDNNRDFYLNAMPESENMSRVLSREWFPQIVYNHHQTGPEGAVLFVPPFRDPHNHNLDPLLINSITMVGAAMHSRLAAEGKAGAATRNGASYQTWWNGGLRTAVYFHNQIGILTETIGSPTPMRIPFVPARQLSTGDLTAPIAPQEWHFRQSIEYSMTNNRAILDYASRYRETLLLNMWRMGRNAIEQGSRDSWTTTPADLERVRAELEPGADFDEPVDSALFERLLRDPARRDPRGYVIPADQPDFGTATDFVNALLRSGVAVHRATAAFTAGGTRYPAGSWVVKTAQAFRPHVLDMFEPQDYPNDFQYEGGPPRPPYDNAGYTLALQMGVRFDRVLEAFDGPFAPVTDAQVTAAAPPLPDGGTLIVDRRLNAGFRAVNRLLAAGQVVRESSAPVTVGDRTWPRGSWLIPSTPEARRILVELNRSGLPVGSAPASAQGRAVRPLRVGLWDRYGGSMPSGWVRWLFEQYRVPFEVVFPPRLDAGRLQEDFDVLVFVEDAMPSSQGSSRRGDGEPDPEDIPAEYRARLGRVTAERTVPRLEEFLRAGGRIVTIGNSSRLADLLGLPVQNHLVSREPDGTVAPLPRDRFYIPASLLQVAVDTGHAATLGMDPDAIVMFDNDPVFRLPPDAEARGLRPLMWFDSPRPLRSGWAWGQTYLEHGVAAVAAGAGAGELWMFGPQITFRAQPAGTFKLLFNALVGTKDEG